MSLLSNLDLIKKARDYRIPLVGVYSKDQLPPVVQPGCYIVNLQDALAGGGTHWTGFIVEGSSASYFDSFGFPSPVEVEAFLQKFRPFPYSKKVIQNVESGWCGMYVLAFFHYMLTHQEVAMAKRLDNFVSMFQDDVEKNLTLLKKYMRIG